MSFEGAWNNDSTSGWVGIDLDGTLAIYDGWNNGEIGAPIESNVNKVKVWLRLGYRVKVMTARANDIKQIKIVQDWLVKQGLPPLDVTSVKDFLMIELHDDRAVAYETNTGRQLSPSRVDNYINDPKAAFRQLSYFLLSQDNKE